MLFDFSSTLFRLEEDASWFAGIEVDEKAVDGHVQAELMRRLTAPTGRFVDMDEQTYRAWVDRVIDPASWRAYPDTARVLAGLHRRGVRGRPTR